MWIALLILALLSIIITIILLLPVKVIVKNDEQNVLILRYKLLFKTFGENPNPNDPIVKTLKKAGGVERLESATLQQSIRTDGLQKAVSDSYSSLVVLLKELVVLLKNCTVTQLNINIRCADEDPAQAAISYGIYNAATNTLLSVLDAFLRIRKRNCNIQISCDFHEHNTVFRYDVVLAVPFIRVLAAFWRAALAEARRTAPTNQDQRK